jgi:hypothetical protein
VEARVPLFPPQPAAKNKIENIAQKSRMLNLVLKAIRM